MTEDEVQDFEDFYGITKDKKIKQGCGVYLFSSRYHLYEMQYDILKFLYPLFQANRAGTYIFIACMDFIAPQKSSFLSQGDIYKLIRDYKQRKTNHEECAVRFRLKTLERMRRIEQIYPSDYEYMLDRRTITREMHALMPFKNDLFMFAVELNMENT